MKKKKNRFKNVWDVTMKIEMFMIMIKHLQLDKSR